MNDNDIRNNNDNNVYRATTNLNTAIENPDVNINSATGVNMVSANVYDNNFNIQDNGMAINNVPNQQVDIMNNVVNQDLNVNSSAIVNNEPVVDYGNGNVNNNQFIPNMDSSINMQQVDINNNIDNSNMDTYQVDENAKYEPIMPTKKKPKRVSVLSNEVKAMMIIIFILLAVVYVIPYIYDFFRGMDLVITNR